MVDKFDPEEWEIVWSGRGPLLPSRNSHPDPTWEPAKRLYNRKDDKQVTLAFDEDNNELTASAVMADDRKRSQNEG